MRKYVALYLTHDGEPATPPLIAALWQLGITPLSAKVASFNALGNRYSGITVLIPDAGESHGILEPAD